jgi:hypothetical protein
MARRGRVDPSRKVVVACLYLAGIGFLRSTRLL